jgi:hypothetical protein
VLCKALHCSITMRLRIPMSPLADSRVSEYSVVRFFYENVKRCSVRIWNIASAPQILLHLLIANGLIRYYWHYTIRKLIVKYSWCNAHNLTFLMRKVYKAKKNLLIVGNSKSKCKLWIDVQDNFFVCKTPHVLNKACWFMTLFTQFLSRKNVF